MDCVPCKSNHMQSNWTALTLPRTEGQTTFLLRSERPFSHYAAALISRNTKIRLNGAIFSFAFGGHFSCLGNSSHSEGTRGSIVIRACSVRVQRPSSRSLTDTPGPQLELTTHHAPCHLPKNQQQWQACAGNASVPVYWLIEKRKRSPVTALSIRSVLLLGKPCKNLRKFWEITDQAGQSSVKNRAQA